MKIHWLSPLFPAKTGVAHYSRHLLPELAKRAEVVVFAPQESWDPEIDRHVLVRPIGREDRRFWRELHEADLTVCHLGRPAAFHGAIAEVARRHASLVVLHESRLFGLLSAAVVGIRGQVERFLELCEREAGKAGRRAGSRWLRGEEVLEIERTLPFTGLFTEGALGVVVHSPWAARDVEREGEPGLPLLELPLPCPAEIVFPVGEGQGSKEGPRRLVVCGHLGQEHRLGLLLEALARSPARERLHLDVFGELRQPDSVVRLRDRLGLQPQVTIHGFVLDNELATALQSARLGFDLRLPYLGGASLARLEMWRHGLPVAATPGSPDSGDAAFLPVREGSEMADLEAALALAAGSSASADAELSLLADRGRQELIRHHGPAAYAEAFLAFAARVKNEGPRCLEQRWRSRIQGLLGGPGLDKPANAALDVLLAGIAQPRL